MNIWYGCGDNPNLSNLAHRPFVIVNKGIEYKFRSVEHAYQSLKSGRFDAVTYGKYTKDGVKIIGRFGVKTEDNYNIKLMKFLIKKSFLSNPSCLKELLATGNETLTHVQDRGIWREVFPKLLMEIRKELSK